MYLLQIVFIFTVCIVAFYIKHAHTLTQKKKRECRFKVVYLNTLYYIPKSILDFVHGNSYTLYSVKLTCWPFEEKKRKKKICPSLAIKIKLKGEAEGTYKEILERQKYKWITKKCALPFPGKLKDNEVPDNRAPRGHDYPQNHAKKEGWKKNGPYVLLLFQSRYRKGMGKKSTFLFYKFEGGRSVLIVWLLWWDDNQFRKSGQNKTR